MSKKVSYTSVRDVEAYVPKFAQKIIGETAQITQTEKWTRNGEELSCEIEILTKGAPGGTRGTMSVRPAGKGSSWSSDYDIKVSIPLLGGKLEKTMYEELGKGFLEEKTFNDKWLADH